MINRKVAPAVKQVNNIKFQKPQKHILDNGTNLYSFYSDNSPVIKLDISFKAGIEYEIKSIQAVFANALIKEAPLGMHPDETAEYFDFYGSFIQGFVGNDYAGLRLYVPKRFFADVIPIFSDLIKNPLLPEKELELFKSKHKETIKNNLKKTKYVAMRGLNTEIFGANHPRGKNILAEHVDSIYKEDIENFVKNHYQLSNCFMQISGMVDDEVISLCKRYLGGDKKNIHHINYPVYQIQESDNTVKVYPMDSAVQSSIFIGKNLGKLTEDQILDMSLLNTVLGGYFGSRLMKNIREDKGYTYGIGSFLTEYNDCVALKITSDVGIDVTQNTIDEVFKEFRILREKKIHYKELDLVKNFMLGEILSSLDGVFQNAAVWEKIISTGKSQNFISKQIKQIKSITSTDIYLLANNYLTETGFHTVVAGKL